jgi:hypothetical protein
MQQPPPSTAKPQVKGGGVVQCVEGALGMVGVGAAAVLLGVHLSKGNQDTCGTNKYENAMDSAPFVLFNITLGISLIVLFYMAIFEAMKVVFQLIRAPIKAITGGVIIGLFFLSARIITNWKKIKNKKWTGVWEYWAIFASAILYVLGSAGMIYVTGGKFCTG